METEFHVGHTLIALSLAIGALACWIGVGYLYEWLISRLQKQDKAYFENKAMERCNRALRKLRTRNRNDQSTA